MTEKLPESCPVDSTSMAKKTSGQKEAFFRHQEDIFLKLFI